MLLLILENSVKNGKNQIHELKFGVRTKKNIYYKKNALRVNHFATLSEFFNKYESVQYCHGN